MREIKFRAWDNKKNEMIYFDMDDYAFDIDSEWGLGEIPGLKNNFMQLTGLLDKKGREIYEGDILKRGVDISRVSWNKEEASFNGVVWNDEKEIIGNIYSNPELIK